MKLLIQITVVLTFLLCSLDAYAIRCNNKIVGKGDSQYRFLKICGDPDFVQRKIVYVSDSITTRHGGSRYHSHDDDVVIEKHVVDGVGVTTRKVGQSAPRRHRSGEVEYRHEQERAVEIEIWTYDFGPNRLVQEVRFVDGIAKSIKNRGYGTN